MLHFLFSSFVVNIWLQTKYFSIYFFFIKFLSAVDLTKSQTCLCFFQGKSLILVIVNMVSPELLRWQLRDGCLIHEKQTPEITTLFGSHVGRTEATQNKISEYRLLTEGRLLFITITMHHQQLTLLKGNSIQFGKPNTVLLVQDKPNQYLLPQMSIARVSCQKIKITDILLSQNKTRE